MEPGTEVGGPFEVAYSCPHSSRKKVPRSGCDPGTLWSCSRGFPRCATESCPEADCLELPLWTADPALSHYAVLVWVRSLPTCPPDCDSPIHTVIGRDHGVGHAVCRAEEQSQDGNDRSTMVGMICTIVGIFALFCLSHGCDPSRGRLGGPVGYPPS